MQDFRSEGAIEGLQYQAEMEFFQNIPRQMDSDTLAREPAATPRRCSPGGEGHAPGWCTDRPDHRPWSSNRTSSAASAASTSAASTASSSKNVRDSSTWHSPIPQWGEQVCADPEPPALPPRLSLLTGFTQFIKVSVEEGRCCASPPKQARVRLAWEGAMYSLTPQGDVCCSTAPAGASYLASPRGGETHRSATFDNRASFHEFATFDKTATFDKRASFHEFATFDKPATFDKRASFHEFATFDKPAMFDKRASFHEGMFDKRATVRSTFAKRASIHEGMLM